jgi:hypothetical protein
MGVNSYTVSTPLAARCSLHDLQSTPTMHNLYLTSPLQSGVASSVASMPRSDPHSDPRSDPALRVKKTLAPKRQPPRPPRPWGCADGPDDQEWVYSWRHVVRVGPASGQWPQDSAEALAEESMISQMDDDDDLNLQVQVSMSRDFGLLFVPCTAQDSVQWDHDRDQGFMLHGSDGELMAFSVTDDPITPSHKRHDFKFTFRDDGQGVMRESWSRRERVTDVVIEYVGPVRFRLRHPGNSLPLQERRRRPNDAS